MTDLEPDLFRYSPVTAAALLHLPDSNAKCFAVASALGTFLDFDGSSRRLRSGRDAAGTLITSRRREVVLEVLDVSPRRWRELVADWESRYLAHRCERGLVFLFARPLYESCPACHAELLTEKIPRPARLNRGRGFAESDVISAAHMTRSPPLNGTSTAAPAALPPPFLATDAPQEETGLLLREGLGEEGSALDLEESSSSSETNSAAIARRNEVG